MAVLITNRAKQSIRGLYFQSTRGNLNRREETLSLLDALIAIVENTPLKSSANSMGVLSNWRSKGYTILETSHNFIRKMDKNAKTPFLKAKRQTSKSDNKRKWYFACVVDSATNTTHIADAVFAPYLDRVRKELPSAISFTAAMRGLVTRTAAKAPSTSTIQIKESDLRMLIRESLRRILYN